MRKIWPVPRPAEVNNWRTLKDASNTVMRPSRSMSSPLFWSNATLGFWKSTKSLPLPTAFGRSTAMYVSSIVFRRPLKGR
jgi:hypothetical protein